jgi:hypothetical protein
MLVETTGPDGDTQTMYKIILSDMNLPYNQRVTFSISVELAQSLVDGMKAQIDIGQPSILITSPFGGLELIPQLAKEKTGV